MTWPPLPPEGNVYLPYYKEHSGTPRKRDTRDSAGEQYDSPGHSVCSDSCQTRFKIGTKR